MEELQKREDFEGMRKDTSSEGEERVAEDFEGLTEVGLVWLALTNTNEYMRVKKRWSTTEAVSKDFEHRWSGFVKLITNAYFVKRMAWFPLDRLQLEQMASCSKADSPSIVAERARIVFTTLRLIAPQFPKD